jgi:YegS/Rv2252/BmrU family lipid kinase
MLHAALERRGCAPTIALTERRGHAHELASAAVRDRADLVIVWGGDGTVNEVGGALTGSETALGLVPAGSGNGLAGALGVSRDPSIAIGAALDGAVRAIDVGLLDERPFFNIAGIGADAHIARLFNERAQGTRGGWPYILIGVREGCRYCAAEYEIELDGETIRQRVLLASFANGREYGMGARIAPLAKLDDGKLDAVIVEDRPVLQRFWHARRLATGTAHLAPRVITRQVQAARLRASHPLEYHVDGETGVAGDEVRISIRPHALRVKCA